MIKKHDALNAEARQLYQTYNKFRACGGRGYDVTADSYDSLIAALVREIEGKTNRANEAAPK